MYASDSVSLQCAGTDGDVEWNRESDFCWHACWVARSGVEREWRHKASGLRTNMLICMACAFFTLLSAVLAGEGGNPNKGQVASQHIVQGIGFLGAGLILHARNRVMGLTSAASVFAVASIGMACGAGLYLEAVLATVIVYWCRCSLFGCSKSKLGMEALPYVVRGAGGRTSRRCMWRS